MVILKQSTIFSYEGKGRFAERWMILSHSSEGPTMYIYSNHQAKKLLEEKIDFARSVDKIRFGTTALRLSNPPQFDAKKKPDPRIDSNCLIGIHTTKITKKMCFSKTTTTPYYIWLALPSAKDLFTVVKLVSVSLASANFDAPAPNQEDDDYALHNYDPQLFLPRSEWEEFWDNPPFISSSLLASKELTKSAPDLAKTPLTPKQKQSKSKFTRNKVGDANKPPQYESTPDLYHSTNVTRARRSPSVTSVSSESARPSKRRSHLSQTRQTTKQQNEFVFVHALYPTEDLPQIDYKPRRDYLPRQKAEQQKLHYPTQKSHRSKSELPYPRERSFDLDTFGNPYDEEDDASSGPPPKGDIPPLRSPSKQRYLPNRQRKIDSRRNYPTDYHEPSYPPSVEPLSADSDLRSPYFDYSVHPTPLQSTHFSKSPKPPTSQVPLTRANEPFIDSRTYNEPTQQRVPSRIHQYEETPEHVYMFNLDDNTIQPQEYAERIPQQCRKPAAPPRIHRPRSTTLGPQPPVTANVPIYSPRETQRNAAEYRPETPRSPMYHSPRRTGPEPSRQRSESVHSLRSIRSHQRDEIVVRHWSPQQADVDGNQPNRRHLYDLPPTQQLDGDNISQRSPYDLPPLSSSPNGLQQAFRAEPKERTIPVRVEREKNHRKEMLKIQQQQGKHIGYTHSEAQTDAEPPSSPFQTEVERLRQLSMANPEVTARHDSNSDSSTDADTPASSHLAPRQPTIDIDDTVITVAPTSRGSLSRSAPLESTSGPPHVITATHSLDSAHLDRQPLRDSNNISDVQLVVDGDDSSRVYSVNTRL